jgi:hypothetical protein
LNVFPTHPSSLSLRVVTLTLLPNHQCLLMAQSPDSETQSHISLHTSHTHCFLSQHGCVRKAFTLKIERKYKSSMHIYSHSASSPRPSKFKSMYKKVDRFQNPLCHPYHTSPQSEGEWDSGQHQQCLTVIIIVRDLGASRTSGC